MPLTLAQQTAVLTIIQGLLPATPVGVGPQWGRFQAIQYDVDPTSVSDTNSSALASDASARTVNISLLFNCLLPVIYNDASDTFPQVRPQTSIRQSLSRHRARLCDPVACPAVCNCMDGLLFEAFGTMSTYIEPHDST